MGLSCEEQSAILDAHIDRRRRSTDPLIPISERFGNGLAQRWLAQHADLHVKVGRVLTEQHEMIEKLERRVRKLENGQS